MSDLIFTCTNCGCRFTVQANLLGRSVNCPSCQRPVQLPQPRPHATPAHIPAVSTRGAGDIPQPPPKSVSRETKYEMLHSLVRLSGGWSRLLAIVIFFFFFAIVLCFLRLDVGPEEHPQDDQAVDTIETIPPADTIETIPPAVERTWTSDEHSTTGTLDSCDGKNATIVKTDGTTVKVPLALLSQKDIDYIKAQGWVPVVFDVPSLVGMSIDDIRQRLVLSPHDLHPEPTELQLQLGMYEWSNLFEKEGQQLLVFFDARTRRVIRFFLPGEDKTILMRKGNLVDGHSAYQVISVRALVNPSQITGIKIVPAGGN